MSVAARLVARVRGVAARQPEPQPPTVVRAADLRDGMLTAFCGHVFAVRHVAHYGDSVCVVLGDGEGDISAIYHPDEAIEIIRRPWDQP